MAQDVSPNAVEEDQGTKTRQRTFSRFEWAGRRMGLATTSLDIVFWPCTSLTPKIAEWP